MPTPDDDRPHGGKIDYLDQPRCLRSYDLELFDHLTASVKSGRARVRIDKDEKKILAIRDP